MERKAMNLKAVDFKAVAERGGFVYCYLRERDDAHGRKGTPYYIGLTNSKTGRRAYDRDHTALVPVDRRFIRILKSGLTKQQTESWEVFYVNRYGFVADGGILENVAPGGGVGCLGYKHKPETRAAMSLRPQNNSPEANLKRSITQTGRKLAPSHARNVARAVRANSKTRTAKSARNRRIKTALRLNVCPLLYGILDSRQHGIVRQRVYKGTHKGQDLLRGLFA
jgi:hypothetical protein